jgi:aminoglycoside phosphotransferase (APT) family kinase protein
MSLHLDRAGTIRPGEELPIDRLEGYLRQHLPGISGALTVEQFGQGHSNLTYLLRLGSTELVLRRPPFGNQVKTAHDMGREYRVLSGLCGSYPPAPRPCLYCADERVLGAPFYVMERRHGVILRKHLPPDLTVNPSTAHRLGLVFVDNLALLHSLDTKAAGLGDLGKPEGYVARQVDGWTKRYAQAKTEDLPALDRVARWLSENLPSPSGRGAGGEGEAGAALIHNDYKYDNLLLDADDLTRIVAVLDWEMATVGDPFMDLGTTLGYWVEATDPEALRNVAAGPTFLPGSLTRQELIVRYQEKTGRPLDNVLFYYCFGLFKIAGIVQQIHARYVRGHTRDARFARLNEWVAVLGRQAEHALKTGVVSGEG